jgi:hypothetical protein
MKKTIFVLVSLFAVSAMANDAIYGGYNPASRCDNPAGLENPIGVKKAICRDLLNEVGIYACILPSVAVTEDVKGGVSQKAPAPHTCLKVRERVVVAEKVPEPVPEQAKAPEQEKPLHQQEIPGPISTGDVLPPYCAEAPTLTEDLSADLIDPGINAYRSNNHYLRGLTIGEYRAACEDLAARGAL